MLEELLRRDRSVVAAGLAAVAILAWAYLIHMAWGMGSMNVEEMAMPQMRGWSAVDLLLHLIMWAVMMVAMMLPSAAPMVLLFAGVQRRRKEQTRLYVSTAVFAVGYLIVWGLYSVGATLAQWGLHEAALLSPRMVSTSTILGGGVLIVAGLFQFTALKDVCLRACRSPMGFLSTHWREGPGGALVMGMRHGTYCVGCCWMLMTLLFVVGVMNLLWVALIAGFVMVEKLAPAGRLVGQIAGAALITTGVWMVA